MYRFCFIHCSIYPSVKIDEWTLSFQDIFEIKPRVADAIKMPPHLLKCLNTNTCAHLLSI